MLYIAVRMQHFSYAKTAAFINQGVGVRQIADITPTAIKERVRIQCELHRDEKWLIINGQITAKWCDKEQKVIFI